MHTPRFPFPADTAAPDLSIIGWFAAAFVGILAFVLGVFVVAGAELRVVSAVDDDVFRMASQSVALRGAIFDVAPAKTCSRSK